MSVMRVKPTRMELTRLKKKLATAMRGHKLLKDKQDELMRQFMILVKENHKLRLEVEQAINNSSKKFALARATMPDSILDTALLGNKDTTELEINVKKIMSVSVPIFNIRNELSSKANIYSYGFAYTSVDLDDAVKNVHGIVPDMIKLAETEKTCQLMADEIESTRRRVNALEHVVVPETRVQIKYIKMKLDENERSSQVRLIKVKDMILEKKLLEQQH